MFNIPAPNLCFAQNSLAVSHAVNFPWLKQTLDFENSRKLFSGHQFSLTATAVYRFPSCPAAALPLIFQTQKFIRLFACKTTMQTERLTVLSSPAIPYRFAATSL